jgi:hypothetical protein
MVCVQCRPTPGPLAPRASRSRGWSARRTSRESVLHDQEHRRHAHHDHWRRSIHAQYSRSTYTAPPVPLDDVRHDLAEQLVGDFKKAIDYLEKDHHETRTLLQKVWAEACWEFHALVCQAVQYGAERHIMTMRISLSPIGRRVVVRGGGPCRHPRRGHHAWAAAAPEEGPARPRQALKEPTPRCVCRRCRGW